jgi:hypothetical protein
MEEKKFPLFSWLWRNVCSRDGAVNSLRIDFLSSFGGALEKSFFFFVVAHRSFSRLPTQASRIIYPAFRPRKLT